MLVNYDSSNRKKTFPDVDVAGMARYFIKDSKVKTENTDQKL